MKRLFFVGLFITIVSMVLTACVAVVGPTNTLQSADDLSWEHTKTVVTKTPPLLDCDTVEACQDKELMPDKYTIQNEEVYVWGNTPWPSQRETLFFVEVRRPDKQKYDRIKLQLYNNIAVGDYWYIGAYKNNKDGSPYDVRDLNTTPWPLAFGIKGEKWAVIFDPTQSGWKYEFVENYWK